MAKKPVSYAAVELEPAGTPARGPSTAEPGIEGTDLSARRGRPAAARTLKDVSSPVMLYLHPAGAKALKRYALDQNTKVHSLLLEAVEDWFKAHGLREPVRAKINP